MNKRISVVIASRNYETYVGQAIDSALAQDYDDKEVIVVDTGSTDRSIEIIKGYGDRITPVFLTGAGQAVAYYTGFRASNGSIVILFDADDVMRPGALRAMADAFEPDVVRVEARMRVIDAEGRERDTLPPKTLPPGYDQMAAYRRWGDLYSVPGSGHALRRDFLEHVMPLGAPYEVEGPAYSDTCIIILSWLFGRTVMLDEVLFNYRIHGLNLSGVRNLENPTGLRREFDCWRKTEETWRRQLQNAGVSIPKFAGMVSSVRYQKIRLYLLRMQPGDPQSQQDSRIAAVFDGLRACLNATQLTMMQRLKLAAYFMIMGILPAPLVRRYGRDLFSNVTRKQLWASILPKAMQQRREAET